MSYTVVVTRFGHVSMCCCSPHFRTCSAMSISLALWFLFLPLWYQATREFDILHPVMKFGCSFFAHEFGTNTRLALKFVSRACKFCARLMLKLGSRAARFPCTHVLCQIDVEVSFPCTDFVFVRRGCGCTVFVSLSCVRDFSLISDRVYRSDFNLIVRARNVLVALFHVTSPCVHHGWYEVAP